MAKPSKHIESGTTDKVTRKGAPRQPVKKVSRPEDLDSGVEDDLDLDLEAIDTDDSDVNDESDKGDDGGGIDDSVGGKGSAPSTETSGTAGTTRGGVRKVDRKAGRADAKSASKHSSKRVTAKGTAARSGPAQSARYTPPTAKFEDMPSPIWVPILMFGLFLLGMLAIFLNYVALLPGATSNWYLLVGLGFILAGIITATQYR